MNEQIAQRIARELGLSDLTELLAENLSGADLHSLLLAVHRLTGLGYYEGPCFHIKMKNDRGQTYMLADGGFVNWTQRMLADGKERLMTSAIGLELLCRMFRRAQG